MLNNLNRNNPISKWLALILCLSISLLSTARPALSAIRLNAAKRLPYNSLSVVSLNSNDTVSDEFDEVKNAIETKFAGEGSVQYKFALKLSDPNSDIFIVPIIGRGFFYFILQGGEQSSFFFPMQNDFTVLNLIKQHFDLAAFLSDEIISASLRSTKDNTEDQSFLIALVNILLSKRLIHTELCVRDDNGNCVNDDDSGGVPSVIGLLVIGLVCFYYYFIYLPPDVEIISPHDDSHYYENECINLNATAVSQTGLGLSYNCTWSSSLDGNLGSGLDLQQCGLSPGEHSITLTCENVFGLPGIPGEDNSTITIVSKPPDDGHFSLKDVFSAPCFYCGGMTVAEGYVWLNCEDNKFYKLDNSGNITDSISINKILSSTTSFPSDTHGLVFDGNSLWFSGDKIYKIDTQGNLINAFDSPATWLGGLGFDGRNLWIWDNFGFDKTVYKVNPADYTIQRNNIANAPFNEIQNMTYGANTFWFLGGGAFHGANFLQEKPAIYKTDADFITTDSFESPILYPSALSFDGEYLWIAAEGRIYKFELLNSK